MGTVCVEMNHLPKIILEQAFEAIYDFVALPRYIYYYINMMLRNFVFEKNEQARFLRFSTTKPFKRRKGVNTSEKRKYTDSVARGKSLSTSRDFENTYTGF